MWQQFLTETVQWIVSTSYFLLAFFPFLTALSYRKNPFCSCHKLSWQTRGEKNLKCKKCIYMTFLFIQLLLSSKWIIFLPMFPLMYPLNSCDCTRLISPNMWFNRNKKHKILKMSPLELVPTVQKKALAKLLHCFSLLTFWALIPSFLFSQVEQEDCKSKITRGKKLIFKLWWSSLPVPKTCTDFCEHLGCCLASMKELNTDRHNIFFKKYFV